MKNQFVTHEQAVRLHKLGFQEPCLAFYNGGHLDLGIWDWEYPAGEKLRDIGECPLAPTYSQAFRWFRVNFMLYSEVNGFGSEVNDSIHCFQYQIYKTQTDRIQHQLNLLDNPDFECFKTYEEAELACLNRLIELVELNSDKNG